MSLPYRRAASQSLQAMDEEGLTTSLVGGDFRYKLEVGGMSYSHTLKIDHIEVETHRNSVA